LIELHVPWLELAIVIPAIGSIALGRVQNSSLAWKLGTFFNLVTLLIAIGAWLDFGSLKTFEAHDRWSLFTAIFGHELLVIDELSAPLIPLVALLHFMTSLTTLRTKQRRFSFSWNLFSESLLLTLLSCREPWPVIVLLSLQVLPPAWELRLRKRPLRVYATHLGLFVTLLFIGQGLIDFGPQDPWVRLVGIGALTAAVLLRSGVAPVHCWMTDLFENASFGTAILFVTPMSGAYAAIRLVMPIASDEILRSIALLSLFTSVYAACMSLVQTEARRFYCYLLLSHASLVLVGLELATPIGLTGALSVWLSVGLSLGGFGLTLRCMESRAGRISLSDYHGYAERTPVLAAFFLLTGLASVGFPGTIGFIAIELLTEGALDMYPFVGVAVIVAAVLNGIAVVQVYFRIFGGAKHESSIPIGGRVRERFAVATLALLILAGGLYPQPGVASRHHAATMLLQERRGNGATQETQQDSPESNHSHDDPRVTENPEPQSGTREVDHEQHP